MPDIRLIALDLDGTLLNSKKELTDRNRAALERAVAAGIWVVPSTGRFFGGMPAFIQDLPFVRYAITINGAQVFDRITGEHVYGAEIPVEEAVRVMAFLDDYPVIYDCYKDDWGVMTAAMRDKSAEFAPNDHYFRMLTDLRRPVPELKAYLQETGGGVQKIQLFAKEIPLRDALMEKLKEAFPDLAITSSVVNNAEINHARATKGEALRALAAHLGLDISQTAAFGDGTNDIAMLEAAGLGIAMENAADLTKAAADAIAPSCDDDGVARFLEEQLHI